MIKNEILSRHPNVLVSNIPILNNPMFNDWASVYAFIVCIDGMVSYVIPLQV